MEVNPGPPAAPFGRFPDGITEAPDEGVAGSAPADRRQFLEQFSTAIRYGVEGQFSVEGAPGTAGSSRKGAPAVDWGMHIQRYTNAKAMPKSHV